MQKYSLTIDGICLTTIARINPQKDSLERDPISTN